MEQKEVIEEELLDRVAKVLKVPGESIRSFAEEAAIQNIQNNYDSSVINAGPTVNYQCTFNPIDKIIQLYEELLKSERDRISLLEKILDCKK